MLIPRNRIKPSYKQGFARSASESLYPSFHKGLRGAWVPSLGNTGIITLHDVSGRKNDGIMQGSMTPSDWVVDEGILALDFDGTNDYIEIQNNSNFNDIQAITVSAWVKARSDNRTIFNKLSTSPFDTWQLGMTGGNIHWCIEPSSGLDVCIDRGIASTGVWTHIVATWDAAVMKIYQDGTQQGTSSAQTNTNAFTDNPIQIGAQDTGDFFDGLISEVLLWDYALTANQIQQLYQLGPGGILQLAPFLFYKFNVGTLSTLTLDADGTINTAKISDSDADSTFFDDCNDVPDGVSVDFIELDSGLEDGTYEAWFRLTDVDSDFSSMSSLNIDVDVGVDGTVSNDTVVLTCRIFAADNDTTNPLTDESGTLATEVDTTRTQRNIVLAGLTGTKAQWNSAYIRFSFVYDKVGGPDSYTLRFYGCDLDGTYEIAAEDISDQEQAAMQQFILPSLSIPIPISYF